MKFKLIQFGTLLVIVMSIVYMAQTQDGYGHDASDHEPQFYVNSSGEVLVEKTDSPNPLDPRDDAHNSYSDSSGNNTESASSWALRYYASPMISGGHESDDEINFVFGARLDVTASAGNTSCSGRITPDVTMNMGLTTDYFWGGQGSIELKIVSTYAYTTDYSPEYYLGTHSFYCPGGEILAKNNTREIRIRVSNTDIKKKQDGTISVSLTTGKGSLHAEYTKGTEVTRKEVHAYPFGFSTKLEPTFWTRAGGLSNQMDKSAKTNAKLVVYPP